MTFSINPTAAKTQAMFQAMAIQINGTGTGSAITGNSTEPPAAAAPAASSTEAAGATSTASGDIVQGTGIIEGGACVCAVSCSSGSFPVAAAQGLDAFGGFAGALPASMMETV